MTIFLPFPFFSESLCEMNSTSVASGPASFCPSANPRTFILKCFPMTSVLSRNFSKSSPVPPGARRVHTEMR